MQYKDIEDYQLSKEEDRQWLITAAKRADDPKNLIELTGLSNEEVISLLFNEKTIILI